MSKEEIKPELVSICTTFFNAGEHLHRLIRSSLNQTYKDIEVILVDDVSNDNSGEICLDFAKKDSRIKYFQNTTRIGVTDSLLRSFSLAEGKFIVFVGSDDWLAGHFIENGVKIYSKQPEIAGVVPRVITLEESNNKIGEFSYIHNISFPSNIYKSEWLLHKIYKGSIPVATVAALMRKDDAMRFFDYFYKNYINNSLIPEELRSFCIMKGLLIDNISFIEILTRYKKFSFDNSLVYIKIKHSENIAYPTLLPNSMSKIFKSCYYTLLTYQIPYKIHWPNIYRKMKIFMATEAIATTFIYSIKSRLRLYYFDIKESKKWLVLLLNDFSFFEIVIALLFIIPRIIYRFFSYIVRMISRKIWPDKKIPPEIFIHENFLNSEGRFTI